MLVAADLQRPAAIDQLETLGGRLEVPVHADRKGKPEKLVKSALKEAVRTGRDVVIVDTAGRLQIDAQLMKELGEVRKAADPDEVLLVVDAMTGQDAVNVASGFQEQVGLTGIVLSKLDGDARGGAAISVREVTGAPVKFAGVGEGLDDLEPFYPDRMASRILGMGDVMTLIEKAEATFDQAEAEKTAKKLEKGQFTLEDFLAQFQQMKRMGPLKDILAMHPGFRIASSRRRRRRPRSTTGRGNHPVHDPRGAPEPKDHRRKPQAANRVRLGQQAPGRESPPQAIRRRSEDDEDAGRRQGSPFPSGTLVGAANQEVSRWP